MTKEDALKALDEFRVQAAREVDARLRVFPFFSGGVLHFGGQPDRNEVGQRSRRLRGGPSGLAQPGSVGEDLGDGQVRTDIGDGIIGVQRQGTLSDRMSPNILAGISCQGTIEGITSKQ